ncbi:MAG TPA: class I SAM-dependent methyltransferase [Pirellulales bacterium]
MTQHLAYRVLEPEAMDDPAEAADYDRMDHAAVNQRFVDDFLAAAPDVSSVLDLGTGTAQIPLLLCRASHMAVVEAVDASAAMLAIGRRNVEAASLSERIQVLPADAKRLAAEDGRYSAVMSNSLIHHLPDARPALAEAVRTTRPGAVLFFRDLFRPADECELTRLVETYAGDLDAGQRKLFSDSLRAAYTVAEIGEMVAGLGFSPASVAATSDRHWTWLARKPNDA